MDSQGDSQASQAGFQFDSQFEKKASDDVTTILRQKWLNEKCSPELLMYEETVVETITDMIEMQQERIERERQGAKDDLQGDLYQMEVDRLSFVLHSYLRIRLGKIQKHVVFVLSNEEAVERLSGAELDFAQRYLDLMEKHVNTSFLDMIPDKFRGLTDSNQDANMVPEPNLNRHVFLRVKADVGLFELTDDGEAEIDLKKNDILAVRYLPFRGLLMNDEVELI